MTGRITRRVATLAAAPMTLYAGLLCCALAVASGCKPGTETKPSAPPIATKQPSSNDPLLLKVGDHVFTRSAFAELLGPAPLRRERRSEHERRTDFLNDLEQTELLSVEAQRRGYLGGRVSRDLQRSKMVDALLQRLIGPEGSELTPVTQADVQHYYDTHLAEFTSPEEVRASHILVNNEPRANALLAQLKAHPNDLVYFTKLARSASIEPSAAAKGGDLGIFAQAQPPTPDAKTSASLRPKYIPQVVRDAAFTLHTPGELYPTPIKTELGFHLLILGGRRAESRYQLVQVARVIRTQLEEERRDQALDKVITDLKAQAHVEVDESKLQLVHVPQP